MSDYSVAVITPTTGHPWLEEAIKSVAAQTVGAKHYVVVDGKRYWERAKEILDRYPQVEAIYLPTNTGANGFCGHRIYASFGHLVNEDYVAMLDEDNWFEPQHLEDVIGFARRHGLQWAYCLRNLCDMDGTFLLKDQCESLGYLGNYSPFARGGHIDTGCMVMERSLLVDYGHYWVWKTQADWFFAQVLMRYVPKVGCTGRYTFNYRLNREVESRTKWFAAGNENALQHFPDGLPWERETLRGL